MGATSSLAGVGAAQAAAGGDAAHVFDHWIRLCVGSSRCGPLHSWPCAAFWRRQMRAPHPRSLNPFTSCGDGYVDGLLHGALGISLLRDTELLRRRADDLLHSALLDVLLRPGLGVNAASLVGAVVRRRRDGVADSEHLVTPESAQAALSATAAARRAAVGSVKGGHKPLF